MFYLLHIELEKQYRGKGYGEALYKLCEDVAIVLGCNMIEQTPSGFTPTGESRLQYLTKRGWQQRRVPGGVVAFKDLKCLANSATNA